MVYSRPGNALVLDTDVSDLLLLLERYAGVVLNHPLEAIRALISDQAAAHRLSSGAELINLLRACPVQCDPLLDVLLTSESEFFRWPAVFKAFQTQVLPELIARKSKKSPDSLRIWSAGCGTGEEAYSVALSLCEALHGNGASWKIHIVASDIRRSALTTAERGLYPLSKLARVSGDLIGAYFSSVGGHFLIKPRVRNLITFSAMNLAQDNFFGHFDCVFCMDVLPLFSAAQRRALLRRLCMFLEPGGYLLLGDEEKISPESGLKPSNDLNCACYHRPLAAGVAVGR